MSETTGGGLQFERVEGAGPTAPAACSACQRTIPDVYYETAGNVFCEPCKEAAVVAQAGGSRIVRLFMALLLGVVAAAVSAVGWYAITQLTGYQIGLVAIVVGIAVGTAVRIGSQGRGGWLYQMVAILLTYLAIGASYVPLAMDELRKISAAEEAAQAEAVQRGEAIEGGEITPEAREIGVWVGGILLGVTLPVLQILDGGFIGVLIVCFALYEAWKINKRHGLAFSGPFRIESAARPSGA